VTTADAALVGLCRELTVELMGHQLLLSEAQVRPYERVVHGKVEHVRASVRELSGSELWHSGNGVLHDMTDAERYAASRVWYSGNAGYTNWKMRGPSAFDIEMGDEHQNPIYPDSDRSIEVFRRTIARTPAFTHAAVVSRGIEDTEAVFGAPGEKVGRTVTDPGFVSVTANPVVSDEYSPEGLGVPAVVHVHIPAGTGGVHRADREAWIKAGGGAGPGDWQPHDEFQEYTIQPGSRYRVDSDKQEDPEDEDSRRQIHVTLLPPHERVAL
jgi:hypothetical protein